MNPREKSHEAKSHSFHLIGGFAVGGAGHFRVGHLPFGRDDGGSDRVETFAAEGGFARRGGCHVMISGDADGTRALDQLQRQLRLGRPRQREVELGALLATSPERGKEMALGFALSVAKVEFEDVALAVPGVGAQIRLLQLQHVQISFGEIGHGESVSVRRAGKFATPKEAAITAGSNIRSELRWAT